jgi:hypothetical protein
VGCSSQNPVAPTQAADIASTAIHTTNPCDHDTVALERTPHENSQGRISLRLADEVVTLAAR